VSGASDTERPGRQPKGGAGSEVPDDARYFTAKGRRWRRTDPILSDDVVSELKSHLGRGRRGVRIAKNRGDTQAVSAARSIVDAAKRGLGERGTPWWEMSEADRHARAAEALETLRAMARRD